MDWFDIDETSGPAKSRARWSWQPGKRNRWTLAPGMMFKDGQLFMLVGGAGAEVTMWGIAQPIVNVIDFGMDAQAALYAPRFRYGDIYHYTGGTETWLEPGMKRGVREAWSQKGHMMSPSESRASPARGTTQMIVIDQKIGTLFGGAAPQGREISAPTSDEWRGESSPRRRQYNVRDRCGRSRTSGRYGELNNAPHSHRRHGCCCSARLLSQSCADVHAQAQAEQRNSSSRCW